MNIIFKVQIFFKESHKKTRPDSEQVIQWLKSKGFDVDSSSFSDTFFVCFNGKENEKDFFRDNLDLHLLAMGERNCSDCALLITEEFQNYNEADINKWCLVGPSNEGMNYFKDFIKNNSDFHEKLKELRIFYSQIDPRSQLIYGTSLLEEWFNVDAEHCLTKDEKESVIKAIKELELDKKKIFKLKNEINNPSFFSKKSRNERIAEAVHEYYGLELKEIKKKIKKLYNTRAELAHLIKQCELEECLDFLKSIFRTFLYSKYSFIEIELH
ncbi:hypothetical protein M0Q39_04935 [Patescibacteria group bacterium]|nr:hypothetical protein [Patescibacteria group bacterium]MDD3940097.1 hypothetical protein [Candidatus Paceibacterota bacterium]